ACGRVVNGAAAPGRAGHDPPADPVVDSRQLLRFALPGRGRDFRHLRLLGFHTERSVSTIPEMALVENRSAEGEQVVADDRQHLIHSWSVQSALSPVPVAGGEGRYFVGYEGKPD